VGALLDPSAEELELVLSELFSDGWHGQQVAVVASDLGEKETFLRAMGHDEITQGAAGDGGLSTGQIHFAGHGLADMAGKAFLFQHGLDVPWKIHRSGECVLDEGWGQGVFTGWTGAVGAAVRALAGGHEEQDGEEEKVAAFHAIRLALSAF